MEENKYENLEEENVETAPEIETTKEVKTLKDLSIEALENMETLYMEEFDEQRKEAEETFEEVVEQKEEEKKSSESSKEKKENLFTKLKKKWDSLEKKQKILIIVGIVVAFLIIIGLTAFFVLNGKENGETPKEPDVILEGDNYRYENGYLIFLDKEKEIGKYECENKDETLCSVANVREDEVIDQKRRVDENGNSLKLKSQIYHNRYVFIIDHKSESDNSIFLYDITAEKVLKTVFDIVTYPEYAEYVVLKNEESAYGVEKISEEEVSTIIPYSYDEIALLPGQESLNIIVAKKDNNSYIANLENKILSKAINTTIVGATEDYIKTKDSGNKYHVYDYNGAEQIKDALPDYISLLEKYMLYVKNNKLFIVDYAGNKMNREGIELHNEFYNPVETYKDLKLIKTEKSYDYELNNMRLNINNYKDGDSENHSYNLYEGDVSSKIPYYSYLEGNLIFYSDEEKQEEIGQYECKNKNTLDQEHTSLETCALAKESFYHEINGNTKEIDEKESLGSIPMANKRYVFLKDGDSIILYDLEEKKDLALYESVDATARTNSMDIIFGTPSEMPFIAKSANSKKFGVATITKEGVKSVLKFEYESIKRLGEYYVVENKDGYKLYKLDGTPIEMDYKKNAIVDYHNNYMKTFDGKNYFVHGLTEDYKDSYNYVELYDEFYAGVVNDRVHLYRYDGKDDKNDKKHDYIYDESGEGLPLNIKENYKESFKISISGTTITVSIASTTGEMRDFPFSTNIESPKDDTTSEPVDKEEEEDEKKEDDTNES